MEFLLNEKFIIPFLSILGASSTIILMQFIARRVKETKQRIYAVSYICDVSIRILSSEFILARHTIKPHIEATKRIVEGDEGLLAKTFLSNEFDILTAGALDFSHLPNEYSLQIGYDDIKLVQMYDMLLYLHKNETNRLSLNKFVKENLKSMEEFLSIPEEKQKDILYTYYDYLTSLEHESNRVIFFILNNIIPAMKEYLTSYRFWLYA
ncbi:MAG: hypothetical protein KAR30_06400, partial [Gammaproteobacteria bacterium]|nr:hypothetical protein [Gammaproteobacteria bacterium]